MRLRCIDDGSTADILSQYIYEIPTELESEPKKVGIGQTSCNNFMLILYSSAIVHVWLYGTGHPGGGVRYIFWVRGRAIGKGIDFNDFGIRNGINFRNFGIRTVLIFMILV